MPDDNRLGCLPEILVQVIFRYLDLADVGNCARTCWELWRLKRLWESQVQTISIQKRDANLIFLPPRAYLGANRIPGEIFGRVVNLTTLDLSRYCSDVFLQTMVEKDLLPQLKSFSMARSMDVRDFGLECLSRGPTDLEYIDITFCRNTTYPGTFPLRERLKNLKLIRRLPQWLVGQVQTPFGDGYREGTTSEDIEVHTYWPDGTFQFDRESQSHGFVCEVTPWSEHFVSIKLQFNNFEAPNGWPDWTTYCFRPSVALLLTDETVRDRDITDANGNTTQEPSKVVMVGQNVRGLRAPKERSLMERARGMMDVSTSIRFDDHGQIRSTSDLPEGRDVVMVSKMKVIHLDSLLPPNDLLDTCKITCQRMEAYGSRYLEQRENELHSLLTLDL